MKTNHSSKPSWYKPTEDEGTHLWYDTDDGSSMPYIRVDKEPHWSAMITERSLPYTPTVMDIMDTIDALKALRTMFFTANEEIVLRDLERYLYENPQP